MTAIYTVWNNYGFALASDSNQTAAQKDQTWVDPVEKILMLGKHQVAFGAAGQSMLEGVEVNELIRSWEVTLPDEGFPQLQDYLAHFAAWFSFQSLATPDNGVPNLSDFCQSWFQFFKDNYQDEIMSGDPSMFEETFFSNEMNNRSDMNILGSGWDEFANPREIDDDAEFGSSREPRAIQELRERIWRRLLENAEHFGKSANFHVTSHPNFNDRMLPLIKEQFEIVFERPLDFSNEIDQIMLTLLISKLENDMDFHMPISFLIVGYGKEEWIPTGIIFETISSYFSVPRMKITTVSDPTTNWYLALAVDSAVNQLARGHSRERATEIIEMAKPHLVEGHVDDFQNELNVIANQKFHKSLVRLDLLTLDRLEFVSRLFVQIEALKSYLDEPIPGVGGDTKVISMTKTTRREKRYKELD